jgi:hypothetical protein
VKVGNGAPEVGAGLLVEKEADFSKRASLGLAAARA